MSNNEADRMAEQADEAFLKEFGAAEENAARNGSDGHYYGAVKTGWMAAWAALAKQQAPEATAEPAAVPEDEAIQSVMFEVYEYAKRMDGFDAREGAERVACRLRAKEQGDRIRRMIAALAAQGTQKAEATQAAAGGEEDAKLPFDVVVGHGTHRKGASLMSLVRRMRMLYDMVHPKLTQAEMDANLAELQGRTPPSPAQSPEAGIKDKT